MIADCLAALRWADEVVVLVNIDSQDGTRELARATGAIVADRAFTDFSTQRDAAVALCHGDWVLVVDADERVDAALRAEVLAAIGRTDGPAAYRIPCRNVFLGQPMRHGGWWPDEHVRLFRRDAFRGYEHALHEAPRIAGSIGRLRSPFIHLSHRDLVGMVEKTARYLRVEQQAVPAQRIGLRHMLWAMLREFLVRGVKHRGFLDGTVGWIEIFYQMFSRFLSVAAQWEAQRKAAITATYERLSRGERP